MVLRHRDLLARSPAHRISGLGVLDEEVGAAGRLFAAGDVGRHACSARRWRPIYRLMCAERMSVRRVDGVLGNAGWGILLFELVQCVWRRFVRARAPERFVRVVAGERCTI